MRSSALLSVAVAGILFCLACSDDRISDQIGPFGVPPPRVSGIYRTDHTGSELGIIGVPDGDLRPYPNPFNSTFEINFSVASPTTVHIEIVRALGPGDEIASAAQSHLGSSGLPESLEIVENWSEQFWQGSHRIVFDASDYNGQPWPEGYYRVYLRIGSQPQVSGDVLLIWDACHSRYRSILWPSGPGGC